MTLQELHNIPLNTQLKTPLNTQLRLTLRLTLQSILKQMHHPDDLENLARIVDSIDTAKQLLEGKNNRLYQVPIQEQTIIIKLFGPHQTAQAISDTHELLQAIKKLPLTFQVPTPISFNSQLHFFADHQLVAFYTFLEGEHPNFITTESRFKLGAFIGKFSTALSLIHMPQLDKPENRYGVLNYQISTTTDWADNDILKYIKNQLPALYRLPIQLIHGDLNASNLLANPTGEITGVLDFEFATYDIAVMELAVVLSSLWEGSEAGMPEVWEPVIEGFTSIRPMSSEEAKRLCDLVLLRKLDVALHFLTVDSSSQMARRCETSLKAYWEFLKTNNILSNK